MNKALLLITALVIPLSATANTKYIVCEQVNNKGVLHVIEATLDDQAQKAEVQLYATTADCVKTQSCGTRLYQKEVLPTVIRLTSNTFVKSVTYSKIIDINRKDLSVVTRSFFKSPLGGSETTYIGSCEIKKTDNSKNLL